MTVRIGLAATLGVLLLPVAGCAEEEACAAPVTSCVLMVEFEGREYYQPAPDVRIDKSAEPLGVGELPTCDDLGPPGRCSPADDTPAERNEVHAVPGFDPAEVVAVRLLPRRPAVTVINGEVSEARLDKLRQRLGALPPG